MAKRKVYENPVNGHRETVKDGFNWPVLFLGPLWYFFNGFAGRGFAWLIVAAIAGAFTMGIGGIVVWIIAGAKANSDKETKFLHMGYKYIGYEKELKNEKVERIAEE